MARASTFAWLSVVVGIELSSAAAIAAPPGTPESAPPAIPGQARPSRTQMALSSAIDFYRRGEYELAVGFFEQARAGVADLTVEQKKDLDVCYQQNLTALQGRRDGAEKLQQAEQALKAGQAQEASELLKALTDNQQFLSAKDKQRALQISEQLRPTGKSTATAATGAPKTASALARTRLQQARVFLANGNYDAAEKLAKEADAVGMSFGADEDSPAKVLTDVASARSGVVPNDAKAMLVSARAALDKGELEKAELLAQQAEKASTWSSFRLWGDSPSKVLKDVQLARAKQVGKNAPPRFANATAAATTTSNKTPVKNDTTKSGVAPKVVEKEDSGTRLVSANAPTNDAADKPTGPDPVQLVAEGRKALEAKDYEKARELATQAKTSKHQANWWDDSPDKLLADIVKAEMPKPGAPSPATAAASTTTPSTNDPRVLVKLARDQYNAGKLDDAEKTAAKASTIRLVRWGLFEDSPDKVIADVRKAKGKRDLEESTRLLTEARRQFEQGNLDEAEKLSYKAEHLHGPYNVWDMDKPSKVRTDVAEARSRNKKTTLPPAPGSSTLVKANADKSATPAIQQVAAKTSTEDKKAPAPNRAPAVKPVAASEPPPPEWPSTTPVVDAQKKAVDLPSLPTKANELPKMTTRTDVQPSFPGRIDELPRLPDNGGKDVARGMLVEARKLEKEGKLIEARQKALDAQKMNVSFGAEEDRPELALLAIAALAEKRIEALKEKARTTAADPAKTAQAEADLMQARQLAEAFRFDTQPIDAKLALVRQGNGAAAPAVAKNDVPFTIPGTAAAPPAPVVTQVQHVDAGANVAQGTELLRKALAEFRKGETKAARKLAEEAAKGPYNVAKDAAQVIDMIDAEEANQRLLANNRPTEAAPAQAIPGAESPQNRGKQLLDQARLELKRGETGNARRLAEEAISPIYNVRVDAENLIRSIDAEDYNQRILTANRSFDAGMSAYVRKDYTQAGSIFSTIDARLLKDDRQAKLKELMLQPDLQPRTIAQLTPPSAPTTEDGNAGAAKASDRQPTAAAQPDENYAQQVKALQEVKFQQLREEAMRAQRDATDRFQAGDSDRAIDTLQEFLGKLREQQIESDKVALLRRPVESRLQQFKTLKAQRDFEKAQAGTHETGDQMLKRVTLAEENKKKQVADLMRQYNTLFKEGKYKEAEMYAAKAHELDPDNPVADAAIFKARIQANQISYDQVKEGKREMFVKGLNDAETVGPYVNSHDPVAVDAKMTANAKKRGSLDVINLNSMTETERKIERHLMTPYSINFKDLPLSQVIDDLKDVTGLNIVPDLAAMSEESISLNRPVTLCLEQVALKSILNLLLKQVHLTYVIKDNVLQVTTETNAKGKCVIKQYAVGDLVVAVENSTLPNGTNLLRTALERPGDMSNVHLNGSGTPFVGRNSMGGGQAMDPLGGGNANQLQNNGQPVITKNGPSQTMQELLIKLITSTIAPQSWSEMGGSGTIEYFPLGMALVVNQTPDIQEQIVELLGALRRLQDQEVSVEVRFISISESFFERIGLDFNLNLKTDKFTTKYEPQIVSQQFKPFGYVNDFNPKSTVFGLTPANTYTQDLDIPIRNSSIMGATPPFGAFPNIPGGNGGLSLGLAFLSDIQVFLFMEAAQGDQRSNVMQAPKLTMFNGQTATITVTDMQFFVTNVTVVQAGGQVVFVPQNNLIPTGGVTLAMSSVISADRRFVRMNLAPTITNLNTTVIPLFPITTFITPIFEGGAVGQPVPFTQFLQQPVFNTITVSTTVMVPDGGTVLIGGLKRLSEGRNEFGPPILSKIPYLNRLFKNTGYGRETESLLIMVTPRIIINAEEEQKQTGVGDEQSLSPLGQVVP